jgi:hypothetical protein
LVLGGEDLAFEGENADVRVHDTLLKIGSEADLVVVPQICELLAVAEKCRGVAQG